MILKKLQDKIGKLQTNVSSLFIGQSHFFSDGVQFCLIFQGRFLALKRLVVTEKVVSWKSKGLLTEKVTTLTTTDNRLFSSIKWYMVNLFNI